MKNTFLIILSFLLVSQVFGQHKNTSFEQMLEDLIPFDVPNITVANLKTKQKKQKIYLLDAREIREYNVSHLPKAKRVGYDNFSLSSVKHIPKSATIVVYCTVGYRSSEIVSKLQKVGYKNVYNLYGSIIEWANQGNQLINNKGKTTTKVHTYSKDWSKWLKRGIRVY